MTTKSVLIDLRQTAQWWGNTLSTGPRYEKVQNGGNRSPSEEEWYPHPYTMSLSDTSIGVLRSYRKDTGCAGAYPAGGVDVALSVSAVKARAWDTNDDLVLYKKFGKKFDDGNFNTPVFVGELGESVDMLANRVRHLALVGRAVRKGNFLRAAKLLNVAPSNVLRSMAGKVKKEKKLGRKKIRLMSSSGHTVSNKADKTMLLPEQTITAAWLELAYGWRPLLGDIADLADTIEKRDKPRKRRLFANHWIGKAATSSASTRVIAEGSGKYSKSIVGYLEEVLPTKIERMGLYDPLSIAWELTPFSFVADWILPVGDYLQARSIGRRAKGLFVMTTFDRHRIVATGTKVGTLRYCLKEPTSIVVPAWNISVQLTRTVQAVLPSGVFWTFPMPAFTAPFVGSFASSQDRLFSAVSLVREVFGSKTSHRVS